MPLLPTLSTGEIATNDTKCLASALNSWLKPYRAWPSPRPLVQSVTSAAPVRTAVSGCPGSSCGPPSEHGPPPFVPALNAPLRPGQESTGRKKLGRLHSVKQEEGLLIEIIGKMEKTNKLKNKLVTINTHPPLSPKLLFQSGIFSF